MTMENDAVCERLSDALVKALRDEFSGEQRAVLLFQQFVHATAYSRQFALLLTDVARGRHADSWEIRRLAALLLQEHLLKLDVANTREFRFILEELGLRTELGSKTEMPASVLKEGYSSRDVRCFIVEFRRRLGRPHWLVRPERYDVIDGDGLRTFVHCSRQECKLALGRYLFSPHEIVARIKDQIQIAAGMSVVTDDAFAAREVQQRLADLPDFEASILAELCSGTHVYWVADDTSSRLNSLVEYPLETVVLVIKPPGSHFEFELKRAGRRGTHALSAVLERDGCHVPPSHRLDGGSMVSALQWDMIKTSVFNNLYRYVHNEEAPISRIVHLASKYEVPLPGGPRPTIDYLTNRSLYGEGFDAMREAMTHVVDAFRRERGAALPSIPGDLGLTVQFISLVGPAQAILCGSTSFRLDLVAKYLSADGPDLYFRRGLQIDQKDLDAKRLADDVLDEVLGVYYAPDVTYQDHDQYVAAALAVRRNRARANAVYVSLLKQIGTMWGTLLAFRGYSYGESFVARNVGVRTIWHQGEWCVRLVFQDHDNLVLPDESQSEYWPMATLAPTSLDDLFINGRNGSDDLAVELNCLQRIYRVDLALREKGFNRLRSALKHAYTKTQMAMQSDPRVKSRFDERFIERLRDWDAVARIYLARNGSPYSKDWKKRVQTFLQKRGYGENAIAEHCRALEEHASFVESYSFLYRARLSAPSTAGRHRARVEPTRRQTPAP
jgi:SOS response regulatory protein OraA/RecX